MTRCSAAPIARALGFAALLAAAPVPGADLAALQAELVTVAREVGGTVGVGVLHLESGDELYLNRGARFPMGSLFKLPLAVELLARVEQGSLALDKTVAVQAADLRPGSGRIAKGFGEPQPMSLRVLLETMLIDSDNTATDLLWKEVGGAPAVMASLARIDVKGITVARPSGQLLAAAVGLEALAAGAEVTPAKLEELLRKVPRARRMGEINAFLRDERDTSTPDAYTALLARIWRGEVLGASSRALLLGIMERCVTGRARLRAGLPRGTRVAHKTGTLTPYITNDAGIVTLPGGAHVAIVVMIRESPQELAARERAIASIARAVYRHYAR
jgi:beta-lactamase class A